MEAAATRKRSTVPTGNHNITTDVAMEYLGPEDGLRFVELNAEAARNRDNNWTVWEGLMAERGLGVDEIKRAKYRQMAADIERERVSIEPLNLTERINRRYLQLLNDYWEPVNGPEERAEFQEATKIKGWSEEKKERDAAGCKEGGKRRAENQDDEDIDDQDGSSRGGSSKSRRTGDSFSSAGPGESSKGNNRSEGAKGSSSKSERAIGPN
jgi:hypothetical protein